MEDLGDGWAAAYLLEDVARLIHLEQHSPDALVLLSAAGALRETIDAPLPTGDQKSLEALQEQIKIELGSAFTGECLEMGKAMSMDQAIAFARQTIASRISRPADTA